MTTEQAARVIELLEGIRGLLFVIQVCVGVVAFGLMAFLFSTKVPSQ